MTRPIATILSHKQMKIYFLLFINCIKRPIKCDTEKIQILTNRYRLSLSTPSTHTLSSPLKMGDKVWPIRHFPYEISLLQVRVIHHQHLTLTFFQIMENWSTHALLLSRHTRHKAAVLKECSTVPRIGGSCFGVRKRYAIFCICNYAFSKSETEASNFWKRVIFYVTNPHCLGDMCGLSSHDSTFERLRRDYIT